MTPTTTLRPPPRGPRMDFVTCKGVKEQTAFICSPQIWAVHVHYLDPGTVRCLREQDDEPCPECDLKTPRRWAGYLLVIGDAGRIPYYLCVTPGAGDMIAAHPGYDKGIRGKRLTFRRKTASTQSNMLAWIDPYVERDPALLPVDVNPGKYLDQLFAKHERRRVA